MILLTQHVSSIDLADMVYAFECLTRTDAQSCFLASDGTTSELPFENECVDLSTAASATADLPRYAAALVSETDQKRTRRCV